MYVDDDDDVVGGGIGSGGGGGGSGGGDDDDEFAFEILEEEPEPEPELPPEQPAAAAALPSVGVAVADPLLVENGGLLKLSPARQAALTALSQRESRGNKPNFPHVCVRKLARNF